MSAVMFGDLAIGGVPRVVGTLTSFAALRAFRGVSETSCDIVEVRLDEIGTTHDWLGECQRIHASGMPLILTLRSAAEGGKSTLSNDERLKVLHGALDHVSAIDVELKSGLAVSLRAVGAAKTKPLIVSFHDFDRTPAYSQLEEIVRAAATQGAVAKVSTMVNEPSDTEPLERLLRQDWGVPVCIIGMGSLGTATRTGFPCLGSCLTYGYLDKPSAPGQLSAPDLVEHLRSVLPKYNEDYIARKKLRELV